MKKIPFPIEFKLVNKNQKRLILSWLEQDYIKKWLHGQGLKNLLEDLDCFLEGKPLLHEHWLAYDQDKNLPFAYLLTSSIRRESKEDEDLIFWCSPEGKAITLDLFICDKNYIGKGFSHQMIQHFLITHFSDVKDVLISPEATNTRAVHVYEKAGFKKVDDFIASWHPVPHHMMHLFMDELLAKYSI
jgi:hypothetical protein